MDTTAALNRLLALSAAARLTPKSIVNVKLDTRDCSAVARAVRVNGHFGPAEKALITDWIA